MEGRISIFKYLSRNLRLTPGDKGGFTPGVKVEKWVGVHIGGEVGISFYKFTLGVGAKQYFNILV